MSHIQECNSEDPSSTKTFIINSIVQNYLWQFLAQNVPELVLEAKTVNEFLLREAVLASKEFAYAAGRGDLLTLT